MVSNATGEGLMISNGSVNETTYKSMRLQNPAATAYHVHQPAEGFGPPATAVQLA